MALGFLPVASACTNWNGNIILLIDSALPDNQWNEVRLFFTDLLEAVTSTIGPQQGQTQVAITIFGDTIAQDMFYLNSYSNLLSITNRIKGLDRVNDNVQTQTVSYTAGINMVLTNQLNQTSSDPVAVILLSAHSTILRGATIDAATILKSRATVYTIGVSQYADTGLLEVITSRTGQTWSFPDYQDLRNNYAEVASVICTTGEPEVIGMYGCLTYTNTQNHNITNNLYKTNEIRIIS